MKKITKLFLYLLLIFIITGCSEQKNADYYFTEINKNLEEKNIITNYDGVDITYDSTYIKDGKFIEISTDKEVIIKAYITLNGVKYEKEFTVTLKATLSNINNKIDEAINQIKTIFKSFDKNNYTSNNYQILSNYVDEFITNVKKLTNQDEIDLLVNEYIMYLNLVEVIKKDELQSIKTQKAIELNERLNTFNTNYPVDEVTNIINNTVESISKAKSTNEIDTILKTLEEDLNKLNTISELVDIYTNKLSTLLNTYSKDKYTNENYQILLNIYNNAKEEVKNCKLLKDFNELINQISINFNNVEKIIDINEERQKAINDLQLYLNTFNKDNYTNENYQLLINYLNEFKNEINNINTIDEITLLLNDYKMYMSLVDAMLVDTLLNDRTQAKNALKALYDSFDKNKYTNENITLLDNILNEAYTKINNATTLNEINNIKITYTNKLNSVEKIKTLQEKISDIEDDISNILVLNNCTITKNINLKTNSFYNSIIKYQSSDQKALSNSGVIGNDYKDYKVTLTYIIIIDNVECKTGSITLYISSFDMPSYYDNVDFTLTGNNLKVELRNLITTTHKKKTSYDELKTLTSRTDRDPKNSNNIILLYTRLSVKSTWDGGDTWNREHVWPQSMGWFKTSNAGSDIHHIRPTNSSANSSRGNSPYAEITNRDNYKKITSGAHYGYATGGKFEPLDEVKGDIARIILYLLVRYSDSDSVPITNVISSYSLLLKWNELDPVDSLEKNRNEEAYKIQGNRNPFIDDSTLANQIYNTTYLSSINTNNYVYLDTYKSKIEYLLNI